MQVVNRKEAIKHLKSLVYNGRQDVSVYRVLIDKTFSVPILPNQVERKERSITALNCDVLYPEMYQKKRLILYIHGGSFIGGSKVAYRAFVSLLANKLLSRAVIPDYNLAPTVRYPNAVRDIGKLFIALYNEEKASYTSYNSSVNKEYLTLSNKEAPESLQEKTSETSYIPDLIVMADGAGSSIAIEAILTLPEEYKKSIRHLVLFSPWIDLSNSSYIASKRCQDEVLSSDAILKCRDIYKGKDASTSFLAIKDLSPALLHYFPSTYIQIGEREILLNDARRFSNLLNKNNVPCMVDTYQNMPHLFQLVSGYFDSSYKAIAKMADIVLGVDSKQRRQVYENQPPLENSLHSEA